MSIILSTVTVRRTFQQHLVKAVFLTTTSNRKMSDITTSTPHPNADPSKPPPKKMVYFPRVTTSFPSKYSEFRNVLFTGESSQLVVMTIPVGGEIGEEVHHVDQHLVFTSGVCKAVVGGEERTVEAGDLVIVPQGTKHNCGLSFSFFTTR